MPKKRGKNKLVKFLDFEIGNRRFSAIIVIALIGSVFIYLLTLSWNMFNKYYCWKCVLPTFLLTGTLSIAVASIINEIVKFVVFIRK